MRKKTIAAVATGVLAVSLWAAPMAGADVSGSSSRSTTLLLIRDHVERQMQATQQITAGS
jgi:hypothetical protein